MSDALSTILTSVRMEGSLFSRAELSAPWGVESGEMATGVFHAVVHGSVFVQLVEGGNPVELTRGDVVFMPFGSNHLMTDRPDRQSAPIGELTTVDELGMGHLVVNGGGEQTSLICGTASFDADGPHPMFTMLPEIIHVRDLDGRLASMVERLIALIADEVDRPLPGTQTIVARLTDALIAYVLRSYVHQLPDGAGGWLGGLRDPAVAEALGLMHANPSNDWTVAALAEAVGMSRSALHARFRDTVGDTPAEYLRRWRVHVAARLLREQSCSVASAAGAVGYRTEAAFSNAFLRVMGVRPGAYKRAA